MKKFMKAIAFATVMCLVLSTAAFAAVDVNFETKAVSITVEGAQAGEQVALIITKGDAQDYTFEKDTILYVDQNATGEFATTIVGEVETIDVYAGYASNTTGKAVLVKEDVELTEEVKLTITLADVQIVNEIEAIPNAGGWNDHVAAAGTKGAVVYFKITTGEAEISDMAWAFVVKNDETSVEATKYAQADKEIVSALGSILTGDVEIAAAVNSTGYTVTDAFAVLKIDGERFDLKKE